MKLFKLSLSLLLLILVIVFVRTWYLTSGSQQADRLAIQSGIAINDREAVKHFARVLTFKTISSEVKTDNYDDQFNKLHTYLKQTFPLIFSRLQITNIGKHALLMKWQGKDKSLQPVLLMGHQDVVPIAPGTEDKWDHPPFRGDIADGFVWGRGALDDKASLVAILEATNGLLKRNFTPERTVYFYFGDNEENMGASAILASQLLEKQGIRFAYVLDEGSVIADGVFTNVSGKVALIGVTEKGFLNLKLSAEAEGGHSSMPPKVTAIGDVSQAIVNVLHHPFPTTLNGVMSETFQILARRMSFRDRLIFSNLWLFRPLVLYTLSQDPSTNALIRTTQAPTIFNAGIKSNVLPVNSSAIVNFRILPGESVESTTEHVRNAINNPAVKVEAVNDVSEPSPVSSTKSFGYQLIADISKRVIGEDLLVAPFMLEGATDSRYFVPVADNVYRYFPLVVTKTDLSRFHGINERVSSDNYLKAIAFYYTLISST